MTFTTDVIEMVIAHMNRDHAADSLVICRGLGERPEATEVVMTGVDAGGAEFSATVGGQLVAVRIPWYEPIVERDDIRAQVVRMYRDSCIRLGLPSAREATTSARHA